MVLAKGRRQCQVMAGVTEQNGERLLVRTQDLKNRHIVVHRPAGRAAVVRKTNRCLTGLQDDRRKVLERCLDNGGHFFLETEKVGRNFGGKFGRDFKKRNFFRAHLRSGMGMRGVEENGLAGKAPTSLDAGGDSPGHFTGNGDQVRCQDDNPLAGGVLHGECFGKEIQRFAGSRFPAHGPTGQPHGFGGSDDGGGNARFP